MRVTADASGGRNQGRSAEADTFSKQDAKSDVDRLEHHDASSDIDIDQRVIWNDVRELSEEAIKEIVKVRSEDEHHHSPSLPLSSLVEASLASFPQPSSLRLVHRRKSGMTPSHTEYCHCHARQQRERMKRKLRRNMEREMEMERKVKKESEMG